MKSFCFIPAKLASTRFKEKNIALLNGKPLIAYAIEAAQQSNLFDDIIVSSESEKILTIAREYGASTPYTRDQHLAVDPSGVKDVLLNFLEIFPEYQVFDSVAILLPTAPLLSAIDIQNASETLANSNADLTLTVCETSHNAYRSVEIENEKLKPIFSNFIGKKTQELPPTYRINGAVIFLNTNIFLEKRSFFTDNVATSIMPIHRSVDIDSEEDLNYAKFLIENNLTD